MQIPLQASFRGMPHSDAVAAHIREKAAELEWFHDRITSCHVTVEELGKRQQQGRQSRVRVDVRVPGKEIVTNLHHHENVYAALRDAFDSARRQLEEVARQKRDDVKTHEIHTHGKVTRLFADEGYGFIEMPDGEEPYFSRDNVVHPDFETLEPGTGVQFLEEMAAEGPQAKRVSVGKHKV